MAEIAVNLVIDKLIPLLIDEVNLLRNVKGQLVSVKNQLGMIQAYLKDADVQAEMTKTNNLKKEWVRQMREVSYQIEDVIDEYLLQKIHYKCGVVGVVRKICDLLKSVKPRHKISSEIGEIEKSLERLSKDKDAFGFNPSAPESSNDGGATSHVSTLHHLRRGALFIEDDQLVGVDHTKQVLSSWLREEQSTRTVISVVGEGGLGKTTIVNKVFDKHKKEESFDCYAWITVSRLVRGEQLLKNLLERFYVESGKKKDEVKDISEMDNNTLVSKLREHLQGRSYMIVFDDVWDMSFWGDVEHALPKGKGRIIITTRDRRVAEYSGRYGPIHIHEMEPLKQHDARNLFCLKAFPECCPEDLKGLSEKFVKKCNGVPLAIVALAGLLSTKDENVLEWQKVYDSLHSKLSSDPDLSSIHQVLSESYQDLDYHLKSCLLYFGLFPEDYSISRGRLIRLWISEGFVENKENKGQTLEEVAEEYLAELIARSLVKVAESNSYGRVKSCWVHDLMHDFILRKCGELNFCQVKKSEGYELHEWTRRLSIETSIDDVNMKISTANYGQVRSCFLFNDMEGMPPPVVESLFSSFKLLVRLDCQDTPLGYLPESVGKLFHLKYLNLRNTMIKTIPKSIGKLQNLETLDLRDTDVQELPLEVNRLTKLRYLMGPFIKLKDGVGNLRALQQLDWVNVSVNGDGILSELKNLKQMRVLYIVGLNRENGKLLCNAIESMTNLCTLTVAAVQTNEVEVIDLESLTHPPQHLQRLRLYGRLQKLPEWIPRLKNLIFLSLIQSGLREDPLPLLKDLSALLELTLLESYEGKELYFREGWFMKLKVLIISLPSLETIKIDGGAMPHLQMLELYQRHSQTISLEVPAHIQKVISYSESDDECFKLRLCSRLQLHLRSRELLHVWWRIRSHARLIRSVYSFRAAI